MVQKVRNGQGCVICFSSPEDCWSVSDNVDKVLHVKLLEVRVDMCSIHLHSFLKKFNQDSTIQ